MNELLRAVGLQFGYGKGVAFTDALDFTLGEGEMVALMGANGCGKSTLLKTLAKRLPPLRGSVEYCGRAGMGNDSLRGIARNVALVRMGGASPCRMTVREFVSLGRTPYSGIFDGRGAEDEKIIDDAMAMLDVSQFAFRELTELSDGERSRVYLAQSVAQQVKILLLDEPHAFLDIPRSHALFRTLKEFSRERRMGIVVSTHSVEYAERYCERIAVIDGGKFMESRATEARKLGLLNWAEI